MPDTTIDQKTEPDAETEQPARDTEAPETSGGPEESAADTVSGTEEIPAIHIRVEGYRVFLNETEIRYSDQAELTAKLRAELEKAGTDESRVYMNYEYGDFSTSNLVRDLLAELFPGTEPEKE